MEGDEGRRDAAAAGSVEAAWLDRLEALGRARGYFQPLGARHCAVFSDRGPVLLVTFESLPDIRSRAPDALPDTLPDGIMLAEPHGWSQLALIAQAETWFRDPAVFAYFDRLVDEGFFETFDRVIFHGAGMGAYAACAFSIAAPGSVVVAIAPQATLDRRLTEWDNRFPRSRRTDFRDRYGYAPLMVEAAEAVYLLYDPHVPQDAMHASLFQAPHVTRVRCPGFGPSLAEDLRAMRVIPEVLHLAARGRLTPPAIHRLLRVRHRYLPHLRARLAVLQDRDRPWLTALLCRAAVRRGGGAPFRQILQDAEAALARQGRRLPPARAR